MEEKALALIAHNQLLSEMVLIEPLILPILKTAALYTDGGTRWHMYSELKERVYPLVGHHAEKPEIATSRHYEAMIKAIDSLLPDEKRLEQEAEAI
jgi:hypothetical protein